MPGEATLVAAAQTMSGPEMALITIIGIAAAASVFGIIWHLRDCKQATERLHQRISGVKDDVSDLKTQVAVLVERGKKE